MSRRAKMTAAKAEKKQQKLEAGLVSELFPKVKKIAINMTYSRTGALEPLSRAVNFYPVSSAIFKMYCLCSECEEGNFDFTKIISSMVKTSKTASKGKISCDDCSVPECSDVAYDIIIKYL
jgi:hypothetical protein